MWYALNDVIWHVEHCSAKESNGDTPGCLLMNKLHPDADQNTILFFLSSFLVILSHIFLCQYINLCACNAKYLCESVGVPQYVDVYK